jgi:hypothetical protein
MSVTFLEQRNCVETEVGNTSGVIIKPGVSFDCVRSVCHWYYLYAVSKAYRLISSNGNGWLSKPALLLHALFKVVQAMF